MQLIYPYSSNGSLLIGGVPALTLAETYGTPLYAYDAGLLRSAYHAYKTAFDAAGLNVAIHYACKANLNLSVMRVLQECGAGVDVTSGGELFRALKAGFTPAHVVFSGVGKTNAELEEAITLGIHQLNAESAEELERAAAIAARLNKHIAVCLRVNPDVDAKTHAKITTGKKDNKFGIPFEQVETLFATYKNHAQLKLVGLTTHIGSQLLDVAPYREAYTRLAAMVQSLRAAGHTVERLDIGGGLGIQYTPDQQAPNLNEYARIVHETVAGLGCSLAIEPGRSLVGNAGYLLTKVIDVKKTPAKNYLVVDAAMNDLARPAMYDAYHHIVPALKTSSASATVYDVVGPICETGDTFTKDRPLPVFERDDVAVLLSAGAYGAAMASTYNARPLVAEVLCNAGTHTLIRRRQTRDEMIALEV